MNRVLLRLVVALMVGAALAPAAPAMAEEKAEKSNLGDACINLSQVRRTKVIDDNTILFYMTGGHVKKMTLAFGCPSLKFYESFSYRVHNNRLCARFDTIVSRNGAHCPIATVEDLPIEEQKKQDDAKPAE